MPAAITSHTEDLRARERRDRGGVTDRPGRRDPRKICSGAASFRVREVRHGCIAVVERVLRGQRHRLHPRDRRGRRPADPYRPGPPAPDRRRRGVGPRKPVRPARQPCAAVHPVDSGGNRTQRHRPRLQCVGRRGAGVHLLSAGGDHASAEPWSPYGIRTSLDRSNFLVDLAVAAENAGLEIEQLHTEYGHDQVEVSLAPATPVAVADAVILARIVIGRVAARHDMKVSFSPVPFEGEAGNGAHLHLSLADADGPLLSGGPGPHGLRDAGQSAIAGVLDGLPDLLGVYAGSTLSAARLKPGNWAGATKCWGLENREAAVRFIAATPGNPHGANVELKIIDPSANPLPGHRSTARQCVARDRQDPAVAGRSHRRSCRHRIATAAGRPPRGDRHAGILGTGRGSADTGSHRRACRRPSPRAHHLRRPPARRDLPGAAPGLEC